jgi:uncharacterized glyoxalase superfamily protein PhnB
MASRHLWALRDYLWDSLAACRCAFAIAFVARPHRSLANCYTLVAFSSGQLIEPPTHPVFGTICATRQRSLGISVRRRKEPTVKMNRLIPMLPVSSMPASVDFYRLLGSSVEQKNDDWRWALLSFGECRLMLDESINADPAAPRCSVLYLYPDDVAQYHRQLRSNGLLVPDLEFTFYGMTEFRIDDPDGNHLWIGQDVSGNSGASAK